MPPHTRTEHHHGFVPALLVGRVDWILSLLTWFGCLLSTPWRATAKAMDAQRTPRPPLPAFELTGWRVVLYVTSHRTQEWTEPLSQIDTQRLVCPSGGGVRKTYYPKPWWPLFPPPARLSRPCFPPFGFHLLGRVPGLGFSPSYFPGSVAEPLSFRPAPCPMFDSVRSFVRGVRLSGVQGLIHSRVLRGPDWIALCPVKGGLEPNCGMPCCHT